MGKKSKELHEAAAIKYSPDENRAPEIVALGKGEIADKIVEVAKKANIPVHKNAELAKALNKLNRGDEIPPELYEVVAEILVFLANMDQSYGEKYEAVKNKQAQTW